MHFALAFLAGVACTLGYLRSAFPSPVALSRTASAGLALDAALQGGDDAGPQLLESGTHRGGLRRAATAPGPGIPEDDSGRAFAAAARASRGAHDDLAPRSFVPPPPFHPPRLV